MGHGKPSSGRTRLRAMGGHSDLFALGALKPLRALSSGPFIDQIPDNKHDRA